MQVKLRIPKGGNPMSIFGKRMEEKFRGRLRVRFNAELYDRKSGEVLDTKQVELGPDDICTIGPIKADCFVEAKFS